MHRGGTYTRTQGRQLKWQNLNICNRKIYRRSHINALIRITQKLYTFPLLLTSCHLTSQTRLRTSILSLSFNSSTQWMQRKHSREGDDARLEVASTRNRDAFGKRQFTALYSTAATYSCLHPSPLLYSLMCEGKERH